MKYTLCIVLLFILVGCGSESTEYSFSCDCNLQIKNLHEDIGLPDEITTEAGGDQITEYHYYYSRGEVYIFIYSVSDDNYKNDECCHSSVVYI